MKKGFTLIELLAVIVILAIIALIATPIVLNIINDTKESAVLRSADFYLDAVELSIAQRVLENKSIQDGKYSIMSNGNICIGTYSGTTCTGDEMIVEVNGEKPKSGEIIIGSGEVTETILNISSRDVVYNTETKEFEIYEVSVITQNYNTIGNPIYYNVTTGVECKPEDEEANTKTNAGCMKFYVLDNRDADTIDLVLDHTIGTEKFISADDFDFEGLGIDEADRTKQEQYCGYDQTTVEPFTCTCPQYDDCPEMGPVTIINKLNELTSDYKGTQVVGNDYTYTHEAKTGENYTYTISMSGFKARFMTETEYRNVVGNGIVNGSSTCNPEIFTDCVNSSGANISWALDLVGYSGIPMYLFHSHVFDTAMWIQPLIGDVSTEINGKIIPVITLKKG